jgi:hypothetical protein
MTFNLALNETKKGPHSPYSPDLAPSDFFLSGYAKRNLMGHRAENSSRLLVCIQAILRAIPGGTLVEVFLE